jgi:hypothetical protein
MVFGQTVQDLTLSVARRFAVRESIPDGARPIAQVL